MDPRVELYKAAFSQSGKGGDIPKFYGSHRYQYGSGLGDVLRGVYRFFRPIAIKGVQTLLKAGGEAMKDGVTAKQAFKSSLKPALGAVLSATADQVASRFLEDKPAAAPPPGPPTAHPEAVLVGTEGQRGSGSRKHKASVYKKSKSKKSRTMPYSRHPIIYNF
jgi:hypothetical protein